MALTLADAIVNITGDDGPLDGVFSRVRGKTNSFVSNASQRFRAGMTTALKAVGVGAIALGTVLTGLGVKAVGLGADANETASLLQTSLGGATESLNSELRAFARNANRSFFELQQGSATFVAMTRSMGATQEQAAELGGGFTMMATDLGSFFNVPTEQALQDIQGALAGSSETMQKYGIDVRETTLKQMALDQGLIDSASETLPRLMRAQLLQQAVMEQASDAMGDAERTSGSWQNMLRGLRGRLRDTATEIGQKLIPVLTPLLSGFMDLVDQGLERMMPVLDTVLTAFGNLVDQLANGVDPVTALVGFLGQLIFGFGGTSEQVQALNSFIWQLVGAAQGLWQQLMTLLAPVMEAITQFVSWKDVLLGLAVGIGVVVAPIILSLMGTIAGIAAPILAAIAIVALLRNAWENNWGGIQEKTRAVISFVRDFVTSVMLSLQAFWAANGAQILASARQVWQTIQQVITTIINIVWTIIRTVATAIATFWAQNGAQILASAQQIWNTIMTVIRTVINTIKAIIIAVSGAIKASWDAHGEDIKASAERFWNAIKGFIEGVINTISEIIKTVANGIAAFWEEHGEAIRGGAERAWEKIKEIIDNSMANIKTLFDTFASLFEGDWEGFLDGIKELWSGGWENIELAFEATKEVLGEVVAAIVSEITEALEPTLQGLQGKFETVMGAINSAIEPVQTAWLGFKDAVQGFWDWLKGKTFDFKINLPNPPDWALPDSPLPIHTAWEDFADFMDGQQLAAAMSGVQQAPPAPQEVHYHLQANYRYEDENSLTQRVRTLDMLRNS